MQNVRLVKYQGIWIAQVHLKDGKNGYLTLNTSFSDTEAHNFNHSDTTSRIQQILGLAHSPLAVEEELVEHPTFTASAS